MAPRVSVIVPARNEERFIERCVESLLAQSLDGELEVIVADGDSDDRTAELAEAAGAVVVANPERGIPQGLNRALAVARGETIVRFDAHAEMPPGYVAACLRALGEEPGAVNVGGWRVVSGSGPWGLATAAALASRFGVGNARIWREPAPAAPRVDVDTVPLGCWPAEALRTAGGWNEEFARNEDFELNHRLRRRGGRIVFDPAIWSIYHPRESLAALSLQYHDYGRSKALMLATDPGSLRPRQLAPVALLTMLAAALLPGVPGRCGRAGVATYAVTLAGVTVQARGGWRIGLALASMHLSWATGLVRGVAERAASRPPR